MPDVWAVIVSVIILMVIYGYVSSKIRDRKRKKLRSQTVPLISDFPKTGVKYNVHLSDGRKLLNAELVGSVEAEDGNFTFAGYDGMLVVMLETEKKAFIKKTAIRYIEEV